MAPTPRGGVFSRAPRCHAGDGAGADRGRGETDLWQQANEMKELAWLGTAWPGGAGLGKARGRMATTTEDE